MLESFYLPQNHPKKKKKNTNERKLESFKDGRFKGWNSETEMVAFHNLVQITITLMDPYFKRFFQCIDDGTFAFEFQGKQYSFSSRRCFISLMDLEEMIRDATTNDYNNNHNNKNNNNNNNDNNNNNNNNNDNDNNDNDNNDNNDNDNDNNGR